MVQNLRPAVNEIFGMKDLCLILRKTPTKSPGFELISEDCTIKKSVICKRNFLEKAPVPKPSKFPCIHDATNAEQNTRTRSKRADMKGSYVSDNSMKGTSFQ